MLHLFIIPHVQTQSNRVCNFHAILLRFMLPRDHFVSRFWFCTTAGVKCSVAAVKSCPVLHFSVDIFSGLSGSLMPAQLSVENWIQLKPVLGGLRDIALIYYPSCTNIICNFYVILNYLIIYTTYILVTVQHRRMIAKNKNA
jgi:hypothetical protein